MQEIVKTSDVQSVTVKPEDVQAYAGPDYGAIRAAFVEDPSKGKAALAALSPEDQRGFSDYLNANRDPHANLHRQDSTVAGLPPELAVTSGIGLVRGALSAGPSIARQAVNIGREAVPYAKFAVARKGLKMLGADETTADIVGAMFGMRRPSLGGAAKGAGAAEAEMSAEGRAAMDSTRSTSGVPAKPTAVTPSPTTIPGEAPPTKIIPKTIVSSGVPNRVNTTPTPTTISASVPDSLGPKIPAPSGSGLPKTTGVEAGNSPSISGRATDLERAQFDAKFSRASAERMAQHLRDRIRAGDPEGFDAAALRGGPTVKPKLNAQQTAEYLKQVQQGTAAKDALAKAMALSRALGGK